MRTPVIVLFFALVSTMPAAAQQRHPAEEFAAKAMREAMPNADCAHTGMGPICDWKVGAYSITVNATPGELTVKINRSASAEGTEAVNVSLLKLISAYGFSPDDARACTAASRPTMTKHAISHSDFIMECDFSYLKQSATYWKVRRNRSF